MPDDQHSPHDLAHLLALNAALLAENETLRAVVAALKRALFGARSEKQVAPEGQLPLALDDLSDTPMEPAKLPAPANENQPPRAKASRNIGGLPAHLARVDVMIEPESKTCPCCQGKLHVIGEDLSEMLDVVPAARARTSQAGGEMDLETLDAWLEKQKRIIDGASMLDGYLAAIVVGPPITTSRSSSQPSENSGCHSVSQRLHGR